MLELEEIEDSRGYIYYFNKSKNIKYKEHPKLVFLIKKIKENFDDIKFPSYRCAKKICFLRKVLYTQSIPFDLVKQILKRHRLGETDDSPLLRPTEVTALIHDIFFGAERLGLFRESKEFNLQEAVSIVSNLIWNCFDQKRSTSLSLMEFKLTMLILCEISINYHELINEHFVLLKNYNNCVSSIRLESLIHTFGKLLSYIGESSYFENRVVHDIIQCCFADVPGPSGLSNYQFVNLWNINNSNKFSHYTTLFILIIRMKRSESTVHQNQCAKCEVYPIQGMRFKCQRCKNLSLCFDCFARGYQTKKHKFGHQMLELNTNEASTKNNSFLQFIQKIKNLFLRDDNSQNLITRQDTIKFIENNNVQLMQVEETFMKTEDNTNNQMSMLEMASNNSENVQIGQKKFMKKLQSITENFQIQMQQFQKQLDFNKESLEAEKRDFYVFAVDHMAFLSELANVLGNICETASDTNTETLDSKSKNKKINSLPCSSTPYRHPHKHQENNSAKLIALTSPLGKSIHGADINKSYLEQNKNDYSVSDLSTWFQTKSNEPVQRLRDLDEVKTLDDVALETKMNNFKNLITKVKEIIDDSYSENVDLAKTTFELENVLDKIIADEEKRRCF